MSAILNIDFETRSAAPLKKCGVYLYAQDPSTTVLCMAYAFDEEEVELWRPGEPFPERIREHVAAGKPLHGWNVAFERLIWKYVAVRLHRWPEPALEQYVDTAAAAAACALPRALDACALALKSPVQKDAMGKTVMLQLSQPKGFTPEGEPIWREDPEKFDILYSYCRTDVMVERAIGKRIPKLSQAEREIWLLDQRINDRGVHIDFELIKATQTLADKESALYAQRLKVLTKGVVLKPTQIQRLKSWLADEGLQAETLGSKAIAGILKEKGYDDDILEALRIRSEAGKSSLGKLSQMLNRANADRRMRGMFMYHGASTGRWAGTGKVQLHNLIKPDRSLPEGWELVAIPLILEHQLDELRYWFGPALVTLASTIRSMITPAPGKKFIVVDYAGVEARGVAWLAGCEKLLRQFRNKEDIYCFAASGIFKEPVTSRGFQRDVGKENILGSGFGMGWERFRDTCGGKGIVIPDDLAQESINWYRSTYEEIPALWRGLNRAAVEAIRSPGIITEAADGKIRFRVKGEFLWMVLPSGRPLAYYKPWVGASVPKYLMAKVDIALWQDDAARRPTGFTPAPENGGRVLTQRGIVSPDKVVLSDRLWDGARWLAPTTQVFFLGVDPKTKQWVPQRLTGPILTENAVQALCRDLLCNGMLNVEAAGYPLVMHVHDELVAEVDDDFGSVEEFEELMCTLPASGWAAGFPLDSEGWEGKRYRK